MISTSSSGWFELREGVWPDEVKERDFFTARGEYRVDDQATPTMKNSLM